MSFRHKLSDSILQQYGHTLAESFNYYCKSEKISDEALYYDLTEMTYKWSIMEVFLIDVLMLKEEDAKRIFHYMKCIALGNSVTEAVKAVNIMETELKLRKEMKTAATHETEQKLLSSQSICKIRESDPSQFLGLNELKDMNRKTNDTQFQYLQINYETIQIQIKCPKQTVVQTVNQKK
eukprot:320652_1